MPNDTRPFREAHQTPLLARITDALGLPTSYFHTDFDREVRVDEGATLGGAAILDLVRSHLRVIHPDARRDFVEAVKAIADDLPL